MIRFMICDTDTVFLEKLAAALHNNFDPCTVEYLYGPSALEVSLRSDSGGADVLLTEIELRGVSSISIIQKFMKQSSPLQVIYMTPKMEYCTEVYDTKHCGFLLKPVKLELLIRDVTLCKAMKPYCVDGKTKANDYVQDWLELNCATLMAGSRADY